MIKESIVCDITGEDLGDKDKYPAMRQIFLADCGVEVLIQQTDSDTHVSDNALGSSIEAALIHGEYRTEHTKRSPVLRGTINGVEGLQSRTMRLTSSGEKLTAEDLRARMRVDDPGVFRKFSKTSIPSVFDQLGHKGAFRRTGTKIGKFTQWERVL